MVNLWIYSKFQNKKINRVWKSSNFLYWFSWKLFFNIVNYIWQALLVVEINYGLEDTRHPQEFCQLFWEMQLGLLSMEKSCMKERIFIMRSRISILIFTNKILIGIEQVPMHLQAINLNIGLLVLLKMSHFPWQL